MNVRFGGGGLALGQAATKVGNIHNSRLLVLQFNGGSTCRDILIYLYLIIQIKGNDLMDQREGNARVARGQHLRRFTFIVALENVVETDAMSH